MFTWVCQRCGRENSPSYTDCPDCKERDRLAQAAAPPMPPQVPMNPQDWQIPQQPQPQQYQPQQVPVPQFAYAPPPLQPQAPPAPPQQAPQQPPPQQYTPPPQQYAQPPQQQQYPPAPYAQMYAPPQQEQLQPQQLQPQQLQPQQIPTQQVAPQQTPPPQYQQSYAPPQYTQPSYTPPPVTPSSQPVRPAPEKPSGLAALPVWLLMVLFFVAFLVIGAGVYYGYQRFGKSGTAGFTGGEQAATAAKPKSTSPLQKYIEVVGIRLTSDAKKKPVAKFVVVNHASSEFANVAATVTLWASTSRSEEDAIGSFTFKLPAIGPNESKELTEVFKTKLKVYELPDWQFATAEVQITSQ
jgi:hypothetical protein